ncbi:MAG: helix-hairpin-helix domain-containing protein [Oscillospiraceae bacterium]
MAFAFGEAASSAPDIEDVFPADLNRVTAAELELIPSIGAVKAAAIVSYRDAHDGFARLSQLTEVSGIGEKTLALLSEYLYVKGEQPNTKPAVTAASTTKSSATASATKPDLTTKKPVVTAKTTTHKSVTSATTTATPVRHKVCINTADALEHPKRKRHLPLRKQVPRVNDYCCVSGKMFKPTCSRFAHFLQITILAFI